MEMFDVQAIEIRAPRASVFDFIRRPQNLPRWAEAFASADETHALLRTPAGSVQIELRTVADADSGTIDWRMMFPDGSVALAQSRVTETSRDTSIYAFVLHAPPVPLEQLEGALAVQRETLRGELRALRTLLEA